jgi:hypothetical protein
VIIEQMAYQAAGYAVATIRCSETTHWINLGNPHRFPIILHRGDLPLGLNTGHMRTSTYTMVGMTTHVAHEHPDWRIYLSARVINEVFVNGAGMASEAKFSSGSPLAKWYDDTIRRGSGDPRSSNIPARVASDLARSVAAIVELGYREKDAGRMVGEIWRANEPLICADPGWRAVAAIANAALDWHDDPDGHRGEGPDYIAIGLAEMPDFEPLTEGHVQRPYFVPRQIRDEFPDYYWQLDTFAFRETRQSRYTMPPRPDRVTLFDE